MNPEIRELLNSIEATQEEAKALLKEKKTEEAQAKIEEVKELKAQYKIAKDLYDEDQEIVAAVAQTKKPQGGSTTPDYSASFIKVLKGQKLTSEEASLLGEFRAQLSSQTGEDGGYIIPEDITTAINQFKQTHDSLERLVNVVPVSTNKGQRTIESRAEHTPFAKLSEYGDPEAMKKIPAPKFARLSYEIEDYAGYLPAANNIFADSDQNVRSFLIEWIGKKSIATRNALILEVLNSFTKVDLGDYKGIKTTLNVKLDPIFSAGANIITNQDGFNYLDQLYDGNNRPLLQDDPQDATKKRLFGRTVIVLSNKTIATEEEEEKKLAPFVIGTLKEAITLWDRQQMALDTTKEGGEAWRTNSTEFRAIERLDVKPWDTEAVVFGQIDITQLP